MNNRIVLYVILGIFIVPAILQFLLISFITVIVIFAINPLSETLTCNGIQCQTTETSILGITVTPDNNSMITDKNQLGLQVEPGFLGFNQYYICMRYDNQRRAFRTGYLVRANAERDLNRIRESSNVRIVKRNVIFIQMLCLALYIFLMVIGIIRNRVQQFRQYRAVNRVEQLPFNMTNNDNR